MNWISGLLAKAKSAFGTDCKQEHLKPKGGICPLRVPVEVVEACTHKPHKGQMQVEVNGWYVFVPATLACEECAAKWINEVSGRCESCGAPILPGDQYTDGTHGYTHFRFGCHEGEADGRIKIMVWRNDSSCRPK